MAEPPRLREVHEAATGHQTWAKGLASGQFLPHVETQALPWILEGKVERLKPWGFSFSNLKAVRFLTQDKLLTSTLGMIPGETGGRP